MIPLLAPAEIESLERATLQAVAPERVDTWPGWLLPMDSGTVGRARSAVPLSHDAPDAATLDAIAQHYRQAGHVPRLRLPDHPQHAGWARAEAHLRAQGWRDAQPTLTQIAPLTALLALPDHPGVSVDAQADAAWLAMFLGEGLDPVDGASRSQALARAQGTGYASVREGGRTVACGAASLGHGWLGLHGLRTAADRRGQGLASALMKGMARAAQARGLERVFLQVDAHNTSALALYHRVGFVTAWCYRYWQPAA